MGKKKIHQKKLIKKKFSCPCEKKKYFSKHRSSTTNWTLIKFGLFSRQSSCASITKGSKKGIKI
jgi:hypothetical protein